MQLDTNLYQDENRHWHLIYKGEELKISERRGRQNIFHFDLTEIFPELVEHLEEYLNKYRPIVCKQPNKYVFLGKTGIPYTMDHLGRRIRYDIFERTGKYFYPHMIRTIWATGYLTKTGDIKGAAFMLNDNEDTVFQRYQELFEDDQIKNVKNFLRSTLSINL